MNEEESEKSISFIENPFLKKEDEKTPKSAAENIKLDTTEISFINNKVELPKMAAENIRISPDIIDPLFINFKVEIPKKLEALLREVSNIRFVYSFTESSYISIKERESNEAVVKIFVEFFENFTFTTEFDSKLIFIVEKQKYKSKLKSSINKQYKESIQQGKSFSGLTDFDKIKKTLLDLQIDKGINIAYIEDPASLYSTIRNIVSIISKDGTYVPKVKIFGEDKKSEYMANLLRSIPGISENVSNCIVEKYDSLFKLRDALLNHPEDIMSLKIYDNDRINFRNIGDKIFNKLKIAFTSDDPNLKI